MFSAANVLTVCSLDLQWTLGRKCDIMSNTRGDMAQLVERHVRNVKASGSNPLISTTNDDAKC